MRTIFACFALLVLCTFTLALDHASDENLKELDEKLTALDENLESDLVEEEKAVDMEDENDDDDDDGDEASVDEDARAVDDLDDKETVDKRTLSYYRRTRYCRNCRQIRRAGYRYSGLYHIQTNIGRVRVYCEMSIAGGIYTFIPRSAIRKRPRLNLRRIRSSKTKVLLRFQGTDTTQPYTLIEQLPEFANTPLHTGVNSNPGYKNSQNMNNMDQTYLYLGVIPSSKANQKTKQGFRSNGQSLTFQNCDANPNSYWAFFPNHFERTPSNYGRSSTMYALTNNWIKSGRHSNAHRTMPNEFFFFTEQHFGGCGAYWQTNRRYTGGASGYAHFVPGVAIGL